MRELRKIERARDTEGVVIIQPGAARKLLKEGFEIIDIKAKRDFQNETVFVFRKEKGLYEALNNN